MSLQRGWCRFRVRCHVIQLQGQRVAAVLQSDPALYWPWEFNFDRKCSEKCWPLKAEGWVMKTIVPAWSVSWSLKVWNIFRMSGDLPAGRPLWGNSGGEGRGRRRNIKHGQHQTTNNSSNYNIKNNTSNVFANLGGRQASKRGNQSWTLHCWQPHTAGVGRYEKYRGSSDWRLHQICLSLSWLLSPTFQTPEIR